MEHLKIATIVLTSFLISGCRLTFAPVFKAGVSIETNINTKEKDTIKKHNHIKLKP